MPVLPRFQPYHDLVINFGGAGQTAGFQVDVDIVDKCGFVSNHIVEILGALKSHENRLIRLLQDFNYPPLATRSLPASALWGYPISNYPRDHPIPVHRSVLILGGNVQIAPTVTRFVDHVSKSLWIHLKRTDH